MPNNPKFIVSMKPYRFISCEEIWIGVGKIRKLLLYFQVLKFKSNLNVNCVYKYLFTYKEIMYD